MNQNAEDVEGMEIRFWVTFMLVWGTECCFHLVVADTVASPKKLLVCVAVVPYSMATNLPI